MSRFTEDAYEQAFHAPKKKPEGSKRKKNNTDVFEKEFRKVKSRERQEKQKRFGYDCYNYDE